MIRILKKAVMGLVVGSFFLDGALFAGVSSVPDPAVEAVWARHIAAWESRNLQAIVEDYDDTSVVIINNQLFRGKTEIAQVFAQLFTIFDAGANSVDAPLISGKIVYITWNFVSAGAGAFFGTDTFVIENGKISVQTIGSDLYRVFPINR